MNSMLQLYLWNPTMTFNGISSSKIKLYNGISSVLLFKVSVRLHGYLGFGL